MKELIIKLLSYEVYIRIVSGVILLIHGGLIIFNKLKKYKNKRKEVKEITGLDNNTNEQPETMVASDLDYLSITDKLLQNTEAEQIPEEIPNKIELMEKSSFEESKETNSIDIDEYKTKETSREITKEISTPEIYNTNTNLEQINKQKSQFEYLKHEIEQCKTKGNMIEYEKKLIQATIDFSEDYYFNSCLGDRYIENEDYKKAQTIFKKLHNQNENDDKILYKLGIINLELNDLVTAEFLLTKAKDIKPENPRYYQLLAEVKYNLEKIDESVDLMEKAVDLRPTKFEYIEILGKLYKETDNIQLYYKTLLKMNALEPLNQRVRNELSKFNS